MSEEMDSYRIAFRDGTAEFYVTKNLCSQSLDELQECFAWIMRRYRKSAAPVDEPTFMDCPLASADTSSLSVRARKAIARMSRNEGVEKLSDLTYQLCLDTRNCGASTAEQIMEWRNSYKPA